MHLSIRSYRIENGSEEFYCYYKSDDGKIGEAIAASAETAIKCAVEKSGSSFRHEGHISHELYDKILEHM